MQARPLTHWNTARPVLKPFALRPGDTIGVLTPSSPSYTANEELFANGVANLERLGLKVKLGSLTEKRGSQGFRSGTAEERAKEFMDLILDDQVHGMITTIGGYTSSSLIPYLDFDEIRKQRKIFCGYSDITSLHLAILKFAGLRTVYGPAVMCWFGDWKDGEPKSTHWFMEAVSKHTVGPRAVAMPEMWSNHARSWATGAWKTVTREWKKQDGWLPLAEGVAEAPIVALNFNTLLSAAGTPYFPDLRGCILILEDMEAPMGRTERSLSQLLYMGVFDELKGLIIGKPEFFKGDEAPMTYEELFLEIIGPRNYPIVGRFDCGHTLPMIAIPQMTPVRLSVTRTRGVSFEFLDGGIETR